MHIPKLERMMQELTASDPHGCWLWTGPTRGSYGKTKYRGRQGKVHRFAYAIAKGQIPDGLVIDHLCRNRLCFNPLHLEAVTMRENVLRGIGHSAQNAAKTHCKNGHPLTGPNLYEHTKAGRTVRSCRTCRRDVSRQYDRSKRSGRHKDPAVAAYRREFKRAWREKRRQAH